MAKVFTYKGMTIEELQALSLEEFIKILPARRRRSLTRGFPSIHKKLLEKIRRYKNSDKLIRTKARDMIILPEMVGAKLGIHNGQEFKPVNITSEMISHVLGEFSLSRKRVQHGSPGFGATRASKFIPLK